MEFVIANIKRIHNGWVARGYDGGDNYIELFMDDDELIAMLTTKDNRHKEEK